MIPDAESVLKISEWGPLVQTSGGDSISNERAIVLIANAHFFALSLAATIAPLPIGDSLLLDPNDSNYERMSERSKTGFGYFPAFKTGLTEEAEIINGRLAMVGLTALVMATVIEGKPMLDIVNEWIGGAYY